MVMMFYQMLAAAVFFGSAAASADGCGPNSTLETAFLDLPLSRIVLWDVREVRLELSNVALPSGKFQLDVHSRGSAPKIAAASAR